MYFAKVNRMSSKIAVLACLSSLLMLNGCSKNTRPAEVEYDHSISPYHRVAKGESIATIAQQHHMDKMELVRLNGLAPPYKIFVGQKLLVKASGTSAKANGEVFNAPAVSGTPEMKGDVEVTPLAPIQGTEPIAPAPLPPMEMAENEMEPPIDNETVVSQINDEIEEKKIDEPIKEKPVVPASAGSYKWPVKGKIIKGFKSGKTNNDGINISAPKGTPVGAANNGVVAHTGNEVAGLGNIVLIKHANGYMSVYTHLDEIKVKKGQQVSAGEKIATVGKSGNVKEPQLHFEIRNGKTPIDPIDQLH